MSQAGLRRAPHTATDVQSPDPGDCRCLCGSLLARVVDGGVELKCRRCKRTVFVPVTETGAGRFRSVQAVPSGETG